jgi:putative sterol carrier protein
MASASTLEQIQQRLTPQVSTHLNAVYALELDGISYTLDLRNSGVGMLEGKPSQYGLNAVSSLILSEKHLLELASGKLNVVLALMSGKLKVSGDLSEAKRLGKMLRG